MENKDEEDGEGGGEKRGGGAGEGGGGNGVYKWGDWINYLLPLPGVRG